MLHDAWLFGGKGELYAGEGGQWLLCQTWHRAGFSRRLPGTRSPSSLQAALLPDSPAKTARSVALQLKLFSCLLQPDFELQLWYLLPAFSQSQTPATLASFFPSHN